MCFMVYKTDKSSHFICVLSIEQFPDVRVVKIEYIISLHSAKYEQTYFSSFPFRAKQQEECLNVVSFIFPGILL